MEHRQVTKPNRSKKKSFERFEKKIKINGQCCIIRSFNFLDNLSNSLYEKGIDKLLLNDIFF